MNRAAFTISGTASAPRGYDAANGEALVLALEAPPDPDVYKVQFFAYDAADPASPLASKGAPGLVFDPPGGVAATAGAAVTVAMPAEGVHSYLLRCLVNDGVEAATGKRRLDWIFERIVSIRSASGERKIVPGETTQYSARGWADAQNEAVDAGGGGGGGGAARLVNATIDDEGDKIFNGDGSGGAVQVYPLTILFAWLDGAATYNFLPDGTADGWVVLFATRGAGSIVVQSDGDELFTIDSAAFGEMRGIYVDNGDWAPLAVQFTVGDEEPALLSIAVTPAGPTNATGTTCQFTATGHFASGPDADITLAAVWDSDNAAVATIAIGGLCTAVAPGTATITATAGVIDGSTDITVT